MAKKLGYARVSTNHQNIQTQVKALKEAGADTVYQDKKSGKNLDREGLQEVLDQLQEGDTLIVTKMDRIARNIKEGIALIEELSNKGIKLHVLNMGLFDNSPTSRLIQNILLSVADWEREMILERQREGIEEAKKAGKYKGRPKKYTENNVGLQYAMKLFNERNVNGMTVKDIEKITKVSRATIYREARRQKQQ